MEFRKMSLAELREYAKEKGIRNISTLKKAELAELLENMEKMMAAKKKEAEQKKAAERKNQEMAKVRPDTRQANRIIRQKIIRSFGTLSRRKARQKRRFRYLTDRNTIRS